MTQPQPQPDDRSGTDGADSDAPALLSRREAMVVLAGTGAVGMAASVGAESAASGATIGGGDMANQLSHITARIYRGELSDRPDAGVRNRFFIEENDDGSETFWQDTGEEWVKWDPGFGSVSAESADITGGGENTVRSGTTFQEDVTGEKTAHFKDYTAEDVGFQVIAEDEDSLDWSNEVIEMDIPDEPVVKIRFFWFRPEEDGDIKLHARPVGDTDFDDGTNYETARRQHELDAGELADKSDADYQHLYLAKDIASTGAFRHSTWELVISRPRQGDRPEFYWEGNFGNVNLVNGAGTYDNPGGDGLDAIRIFVDDESDETFRSAKARMIIPRSQSFQPT